MPDMLRQFAAIIGVERRWRWPLLLGLALVVTAFEMLGALVIFSLLGLAVSSDTSIAVPLIGDVASRFPDKSLRQLQVTMALVVGGFFLLRFIAMAGRAYVQNRLVSNAVALLAGQLLRGYLAMPYLEHTRRNSAGLIRNVYTTTQEFSSRVMKPLIDVAAETVLVLGLAIVLLITSPQAIGLAVLILGPTVLILQHFIQPRLRDLGREVQDSASTSIASVQQALGGVRDVKLLGGEEAFATTHLRERLRLARAQHLSLTLSELPRLLIETALVLTIVAVFMVAVLAGLAIEEVVSTLGLFAYAGLRLQPSLQKIVAGLNNLKFGSAILEDLSADVLAIDRWMSDPSSSNIGSADLVKSTPAIVAEAVEFSYVDGCDATLRGIDLTIQPGEFVGICGPTGGGKSTLVDLLVGLIEPSSGTITVGGRIIGQRPMWWWEQLGVVSQHVFLVDDTLWANIALGVNAADIDPTRLIACVRQAQLDKVVAALPDGLNTFVGERGIRLSGGQRQRVAIARALYREPSVLVLDEGTSALDTVTEAALMAAIEDVNVDRTIIAVAHRIRTVRHADRILVVAGGQIVDEGTYDDLIDRSDVFRTLAIHPTV